MKSTGLLVGAGLIAFLLYQGALVKNTVQQLTYYLLGIKYDKSNSNLFRTTLLVTLRINNINSTAVGFGQFTGSLKMNGQTIAQAMCNGAGQGLTIKATGTTDITFPVTISHINLAMNIKEIITQWSTGTINHAITLVGNLTAGGFTIPIEQTVNIAFLGTLGGFDFKQESVWG